MKTIVKSGTDITLVHAYGNTYITKDAHKILTENIITPAQVKSVYGFPHVILTKVLNGLVDPIEIKCTVLLGIGLIKAEDMEYRQP
jgi:hypothetical protein